MSGRTLILGTVRLLSAAEGGLRKAISSGYRPMFYYEKNLLCGMISLEGQSDLLPGSECSATIDFIDFNGCPDAPKIGDSLQIFDGIRLIGNAIVDECISVDE